MNAVESFRRPNLFVSCLLATVVFGLIDAATSAGATFVAVSLAGVANAAHTDLLGEPESLQTLGGVPLELLPTSGNNLWGRAPEEVRTLIIAASVPSGPIS